MTDYAVVVLAQMARQDGGAVMTAPSLAAATGLPAPSVVKILKTLARGRLVAARRGAAGGYVLARPAGEITVNDIIAALEGPLALTACVDGTAGLCHSELACPIRGRWDAVNGAIRSALDGVTLAEMAAPQLQEAL